MADRPGFTHQRERHGLIGPFSGRQLLAIVRDRRRVHRRARRRHDAPGHRRRDAARGSRRRRPSSSVRRRPRACKPGDIAPEFSVERADGTTFQLTDLDGKPIRLADLRGKGVWVNFWATWCPPCQQELPILRDLQERYRDAGLEVVAISVQETSPADVAAYAAKYELPYTIGFDTSGDIFHRYKGYALPTHFFIGPDGVIRDVVYTPLTEAQAIPRVEAILPAPGSSPAP